MWQIILILNNHIIFFTYFNFLIWYCVNLYTSRIANGYWISTSLSILIYLSNRWLPFISACLLQILWKYFPTWLPSFIRCFRIIEKLICDPYVFIFLKLFKFVWCSGPLLLLFIRLVYIFIVCLLVSFEILTRTRKKFTLFIHFWKFLTNCKRFW